MNNYDASSIEVLAGLEPVKRRPSMYTNTENPNHLAQEVIDNSVDETLAGYGQLIKVTLHRDGALSVADEGRGMPVNTHKKEGIPGVEVILTKLHAGGKFNNSAYTTSGGLHGVGVSVVNALSKKLEVSIKRNGKIYQIAFENGQKKQPLKEVGVVGKRNTGTRVKFIPNPIYFDSPTFKEDAIKAMLRSKALLCPRLETVFIDESCETQESWRYENGLGDYVESRLSNCSCLLSKTLIIRFNETESLDCALNWKLPTTKEPSSESYVNLIPTPLGGSHVNGLRGGLTDALREFCEFHHLLPKNLKLAPEDVWQGLYFVLSIKMNEPQFSGQTKDKLVSKKGVSFVASIVKDAFSLWLNKHTEVAHTLAEFVINNAKSRTLLQKKVTRKKIVSGPALPGKLADCISNELEKTEIFLVEGDSAGGSAKQARDKQFQAILPLRGKILNTWEVESSQILASNEIQDISTAIGLEPASDDLSGLRYGKVCILADADSDGLHIATLVCALLVRHFPDLVRAGHAYVAMPPLYRIDVGKEVYYALNDFEKDKILKQNSNKKTIQVQRFKGLGEMNPLQLRETTMLPSNRRLVQLSFEEPFQAVTKMDMLLSKKRASDRKKWLENKGNLANV